MGPGDILRGMPVVDRQGRKIGLVAALYGAPDGGSDLNAFVVDRDSMHTGYGLGYVKVQQGGILGVGCRNMYIPYNAILDITPQQQVSVDCTLEECQERFGERPSFIG